MVAILVFIMGVVAREDALADRVGPPSCARNGYMVYVDGWFWPSCATYNADGTVQAKGGLWDLLEKEK